MRSHFLGRLGRWAIGAGLAAACGGRAWGGGAVLPEWRDEAGYRAAPLRVPATGTTGFTALAAETTGVTFTNWLADRTVARNRVYENGSGVALGDVDGDGHCDLYFCRLEGPNVLYRNLGSWRFQDVTASAGVACPDQFSTGAALADVDGDGDLDLVVNSLGGGTRLFLNDGRGRFTERTGTRLVRRFGSTSMALADMDADGDLDLYVTNYRTDTYRDRPPGLKVEARMEGGRIVVTPAGRFLPIMPQGGAVEVVELGERDFLYLNDGAGNFAPVSWTSGSFLDEDGRALSEPPLDWGLSVLFRDLNQDGAPDLYICNDFFLSPDRIWINEGSRRFRALPRTARRNMSLASMNVDCADLDRDGRDDLLVTDMVSRHHRDRQRQRPEMMQGRLRRPITDPEFCPEVPRNTLFLNTGGGTYAEIAQLSGLAASEWTWSALFLDVDLDGFEDVLVANGNHHDVQDADVLRTIDAVRDRESPEARLARFPRLHTPNLAFRNRGDLTFEETSAAWGFDLAGVSQGMALADLDLDGDLDVVLNNLNACATLYRNDSAAPRLAVRLRGQPPNTRGIGARIEVRGGSVPHQSQEILAGGRYLSCDEAMRVFAAGGGGERRESAALRIEVAWRSGRRSVVETAEANHLYEIQEPAAPSPPKKAPPGPAAGAPLFVDVSERLGHAHVDAPFDDLARQPLLTQRWGGLGPGVAWVDLAGDGREALVVGAGTGGRLAVLEFDGVGGFVRREGEVGVRDLSGLASWTSQGTNTTLLVGSANYEDDAPSAAPSQVQQLVVGERAVALADTTAAVTASGGPLAVGDADGDGDLDLFVGGRIAGGRFPEPVDSALYLNQDGRLILDDVRSRALRAVGMVSGAVWADLDGDGTGELVLACHWGAVRVFRAGAKGLRDRTESWGLDRHLGWWNGVTTGDFDEDGRLDLVVSNWGRNTRFQSYLANPLRLYYRDFDGDGRLETLEAFRDPESGRWVPWQDFEVVCRALPFVRALFPSYRAYGEAGIEELLSPAGGAVPFLQANTLDSTVFLNRGTSFLARPLPVQAQFAPAFGVSVADFDGDGHHDVLLAQNFFAVTGELSRFDGGRGLWLRGDGQGGFEAVSPEASGIQLTGEQRGCAVADFDGDGRPDVALGQNNGPTRLLRNARGKPGLRVRLDGPVGNPRGIGAVLRLEFADRLGPATAVQAGSGYWSQDSLCPVLGVPQAPAAVRIRWPGGRETRSVVGADARECRIRYPPVP